MTALRSLLFNLAFYGWTALACVVALPTLALPRGVLVRLARLWARGIVLLLAALLDLRHEVRGDIPHPKGGAIYAFKHQSAWDTLLLPLLLRDPAIVLKKELLAIPLFGWYLAKTGQIAIDRRGGATALKRMVRAAERCVQAGRPLVIFPEGTRTAPGQHRPYLPGVAALYRPARAAGRSRGAQFRPLLAAPQLPQAAGPDDRRVPARDQAGALAPNLPRRARAPHRERVPAPRRRAGGEAGRRALKQIPIA